MARFTDKQTGYLGAVGCNLIWGVAPIYFALLVAFPMVEIVAHRAFWAAVFLFVILVLSGGLRSLSAAVASWPVFLALAAGAVLVTINWTAYLYAVETGQIAQSALGYFLYPLMVIGLSVTVLGEKLSARSWAALACAAAGVAVKAAMLDGFPWVALIIGASFAVYALIRKRLAMDPFAAMVAELLMIAPFACAVIIWVTATTKAEGASFLLDGTAYGAAMALSSGVVTSAPLVLFHIGNRYLPLSVAGFMFYINPSLQLLLSLFVFSEPFTGVDMAAFALIWLALILHLAPAGRSAPPNKSC